jgi:hypothetical protein
MNRKSATAALAKTLTVAETRPQRIAQRKGAMARVKKWTGPKLLSPSWSADCNQALSILAELLRSLLNGSAGIGSLDPAHQLGRATSDQIIHQPIMQRRGLRPVSRRHQWSARHRITHPYRAPARAGRAACGVASSMSNSAATKNAENMSEISLDIPT